MPKQISERRSFIRCVCRKGPEERQAKCAKPPDVLVISYGGDGHVEDEALDVDQLEEGIRWTRAVDLCPRVQAS